MWAQLLRLSLKMEFTSSLIYMDRFPLLPMTAAVLVHSLLLLEQLIPNFLVETDK